MPNLPTAEWNAALEKMAASLTQTLGELERHRSSWDPILDDPTRAAPPEALLSWMERRLAQWDERLHAAAELAASVESRLEDREVAVGRWQDVFARWKELIQRKADPLSLPTG